ncbi:DUF484 family protein [Paracoccus sp. Z118]|uniref:DUF484 family protein n=1 Tax=Paracoccus sp. Z118 TaxID=2851017 RepID=UPI001C2CB3E2|nr:DUF484 family protein [Paracoccus sp. Z118]MBV0891336.1 DUF484 family protein [Paracoccus sp. Z118]
MTDAAAPREDDELDDAIRGRLLADPALILHDRDLMRALVAAREAELGANVIDIRGRAMEALESRLDRLEAAHETVISAAYENQSGTQTIHRAIIALLEPVDFAGFLDMLNVEVAPILRVDTLRLVMETANVADPQPDPNGALQMMPAGTVAQLISAGRRAPRGADIILRKAASETLAIHGEPVASEALLPIDLGPNRHPALLLMGSAEPGRFTPAQGTDLLRFFGQVFRLVLLGWLRE